MRSKFKLLLATLVSTTLYSAEPSAYGAGDLNSPAPYGLTEEEQAILQTKKHIKKVEVKTTTKVNSLRERLDGLQTIVEGLARKNRANSLELEKLKKQLGEGSEYETRMEKLLNENATAIAELKEQLQTIQKEYVSKEELAIVVDSFNQFKKLVASQLGVKDPLDKYSKAKILKDANSFYKRKYYTKAIRYYKYLLAHNYRPAYSSYLLGEIYYYRKNYKDAIAYYKESAKRYSKASYMPTLLLHTAISMHKLNDKKNAQKFFQAVIVKYPSSKEAKIAKKYIK